MTDSDLAADQQLLSKRDLATRLTISKRTVDDYMRRGRLPYLKIGRTVRFRWSDVLEKLNGFRVH